MNWFIYFAVLAFAIVVNGKMIHTMDQDEPSYCRMGDSVWFGLTLASALIWPFGLPVTLIVFTINRMLHYKAIRNLRIWISRPWVFRKIK